MKKSALLVIDAQNEMFAEANPVYNSERLLTNLQSLIEQARAAKVPVIYVQHNDGGLVKGTHDWEIHEAIPPKAGEPIIQKWYADAFHETELHEKLKGHGIEHVIIAGNQTEYCIDTSTRRAFSLGYKVTLVGDAHGTWESDELSAKQIIDHHNGILRGFGEVKDTAAVEFDQ